MVKIKPIKIATASGKVERPGEVRGPFAVVKCDSDCWTCTHIKTGRKIGPEFKHREAAACLADEIAPLFDWNSVSSRKLPPRELLDKVDPIIIKAFKKDRSLY